MCFQSLALKDSYNVFSEITRFMMDSVRSKDKKKKKKPTTHSRQVWQEKKKNKTYRSE